jgi:pimeloyl-ACP methyl ester carboxylesterase
MLTIKEHENKKLPGPTHSACSTRPSSISTSATSRSSRNRQGIKARTLTSIGYFGSSTGGGAALLAAADVGPRIDAVVSRGGRPDLAGDALLRVQSPTLLIVGEYDDVVIRLNEEAIAELRCEKELQTVPGATHLFEEPGALEGVAHLAANWFRRHLHTHSEATD